MSGQRGVNGLLQTGVHDRTAWGKQHAKYEVFCLSRHFGPSCTGPAV